MNRHAELDRAREELGFRPGNMRDAVLDAYEFFRREGMIRA
jgi:hypothetical protein